MKKVELPVHEHPLFLFDRFCRNRCKGCGVDGYFYGGYLCNELGCETFFHKECVESVPEIKHPSHPKHQPLKLNLKCGRFCCSLCMRGLQVGYHCSICDFNIHLVCAKRTPSSSSSTSSSSPSPLPTTLENSKVHGHPLLLSKNVKTSRYCKMCNMDISINEEHIYECRMCNMRFHWECVGVIPDVYHTCHPKHPLKFFKYGAPGYADENCLLCRMKFSRKDWFNCDRLYHCDICNVTICNEFCMANPPPVSVVSPTTHEHKLHLIPRLVNFTCNACGTSGDRSPYFCLQCNFMIHRECIDLPRIININRHNHRISYTRYLGHGNWTCGVCRKKVDGFYGGYSCSRCPSYAVHARCAMRKDVWDKVELEGTPEEEEIPPFEVVGENRIKHFSHGHILRLNKDGKILHESKLCEACASQIINDSFYGCEQCDYILHEICASLPRKIRHVSDNLPFTLQTDKDRRDSPRERRYCSACDQHFTGFNYQLSSGAYGGLDARCSSISEPFLHESHPHPLYYKLFAYPNRAKCSACDRKHDIMRMLCCDECEFGLDFRCATLPRKLMNQRYDDHPLYLSYGENVEDGEFWCEVCETKVDPKEWFYTCKPCGITLHVSCVVGDFSYYLTGQVSSNDLLNGVVVPNTSICRPHCFKCSSRCKVPYILQVKDIYYCSEKCCAKPEYAYYYEDLDF